MCFQVSLKVFRMMCIYGYMRGLWVSKALLSYNHSLIPAWTECDPEVIFYSRPAVVDLHISEKHNKALPWEPLPIHFPNTQCHRSTYQAMPNVILHIIYLRSIWEGIEASPASSMLLSSSDSLHRLSLGVWVAASCRLAQVLMLFGSRKWNFNRVGNV